MVSPLGAAGSKVRAQPNIWLAVRGVVRCASSLGTRTERLALIRVDWQGVVTSFASCV